LDLSDIAMGLVAAGDAWDAESREIRNLTGGTDTGDAVEYGQMVAYLAASAGVPSATGSDNKLLSGTAGTLTWGDRLQYILDHDLNSAAIGPSIVAQRGRGAGTATAGDIIGAFESQGEDDAAAAETYAVMAGEIVDPTAANPDGRWNFQTVIAGTLADRVHIGNGLYTVGATGGDKGADTLNVSSIYLDNVLQVSDAAFLAADNAWTGSQRSTFVELTDAATVAVDFATEQNMWVTVAGDRTIGQPGSQVSGQCGFIVIEQDPTGGRTTSWHADWDFGADGAPTFDTTANKKGVVAYMVDWDTTVVARFIGDF
jgi:hypothetical protein